MDRFTQPYIPSGELQGDDTPIPNRGTKVGFAVPVMDGGFSLDFQATNSLGSAYTAPNQKYDRASPGEDAAGAQAHPVRDVGQSLGLATRSDPMFDRTPDDENNPGDRD